MIVLWILALAVSALLVWRFGSFGAIAGVVTIWATGIVENKVATLPTFSDALWDAGFGGIAGAFWTIPILAIREWNRKRQIRQRDCAGRLVPR